MTKHEADLRQRRSLSEQLGGKSMAQSVWANGVASSTEALADDLPNGDRQASMMKKLCRSRTCTAPIFTTRWPSAPRRRRVQWARYAYWRSWCGARSSHAVTTDRREEGCQSDVAAHAPTTA